MTSDQAMRASDRDRERAAEVLRDAYAVGRLDLEEFHDRAGAAYAAKTWGDLRNLTADLPAGQIPGQAEHDAGPRTAPARPGPAPRPFASLWVMAVIWLAIAAAAHAAAAAIPLVLLSLFVLRAARWTVPPEQAPTTQAEHAQPACCTARTGRSCSATDMNQ